MKLKKYYKITGDNRTETKTSSPGTLQDGTDTEIMDRGKYDQSDYIQNLAKKSFKEYIKEEY